MNPVDAFDAALDLNRRAVAAEPVRALLAVAREVGRAVASSGLDAADRERIYLRSLALLEDAVHEQRRGWQRLLRLQHPRPALVGGAAALTIGAAAIGWAVLHGRRAGSRPVAA